MNSLIQQLYLVEAFRCGVFSTPSKFELKEPSQEAEVANEANLAPRPEETKLIEAKAPSDNDILFREFRLMFAHLQNGATRYYDTLPFCRAFKDYDGRPVNLGDQKDVVNK